MYAIAFLWCRWVGRTVNEARANGGCYLSAQLQHTSEKYKIYWQKSFSACGLLYFHSRSEYRHCVLCAPWPQCPTWSYCTSATWPTCLRTVATYPSSRQPDQNYCFDRARQHPEIVGTLSNSFFFFFFQSRQTSHAEWGDISGHKVALLLCTRTRSFVGTAEEANGDQLIHIWNNITNSNKTLVHRSAFSSVTEWKSSNQSWWGLWICLNFLRHNFFSVLLPCGVGCGREGEEWSKTHFPRAYFGWV